MENFINYIFGLFIIIFISINFYIIYIDYKKKIISNISLGVLLCILPLILILYGYIFGSFPQSFWGFIINYISSIFILFLIFYFGIWGAGDAKYMLILSLFIPHVNIMVFLGNLGLVTLGIFSIYFLYFYSLRFFLNKGYRKYILKQINYSKRYAKNIKYGNTFLKQILLFLFVFVCFRILHQIISAYFLKFEQTQLASHFSEIHIKIIVIIGIISCVWGIMHGINLVSKSIFKHLINKGYPGRLLQTLGIIGGLFGLGSYIIIQFMKAPYDIISFLGMVMSFYLGIHLGVKILKKLIMFSFSGSQLYNVSVDKLEPGMVVDKKNIEKLLGNKKRQTENLGYNMSTKVLDKDSIKSLKRVIKSINKIITRNKKEENYIESIVMVRTSSFSPYIFFGFIISLIYQGKLMVFFFDFLSQVLQL